MRTLFSTTGSSGNCTVIQSDGGSLLTIDCGLKFEKVNKEVGYLLNKSKTLLVSHLHADHFLHRDTFVSRGMSLYCGEEAALKTHYTGVYEPLIHGKQYDVDGFRFIPLKMVHSNSDGTDCECFGFMIQDKMSNEKMLHITDSMMIPYTFPALEYYSLECNYVEQESYADDLEAIERSVEMRRVRSHLSLQSCSDFLARQDLSKCKEVRLLHLSHSLTQAERDSIVPYIKNAIKRSDIQIVY